MRAYDFVHSYFEAWNHRDPIAIADHLDCNGTYCDVPENRYRTQDELIISLEQFFRAHWHRYELVGDILEGPNTVAFQYRMCPHVQDRNRSDQSPILGAEFITMHGDTASTILDYYDVPRIEQQENNTKRKGNRPTIVKYAKSGLNSQQLADYKQTLEHVMRVDQAFLNPDLTLPKLAELVDCSVNHMSQVINAGFGVSFHDFLNAHRVEYAKVLLSDCDNNNGAILNIAFTVGFSSNSAFYAAFKKNVGQTPAQYRRVKSRTSH